MIKQLLAFLFLIIIPTFCLADFVGSVDKRRYVTSEEKSIFPYNKVVRIEIGDASSTGTIVAPNVILTCRHCIDDAGKNGRINFYKANGQYGSGSVWYYPENDTISNDYALVVFDNVDTGPFLNVNDVSVPDNRVMRIGYDSLKVLSNKEIPVVKKAFSEVLAKYKTITAENVNEAIDDIEIKLQKYDCKSSSDVNCVRCSGNGSCIFNDTDNLKVQESCSATKMQSVSSGGTLIATDCAGNQGGSGSPLIDSSHKNIIGIFVGTFGFSVGNEVTSYGVRPEQFAPKAKSLINMSNNGLIDF